MFLNEGWRLKKDDSGLSSICPLVFWLSGINSRYKYKHGRDDGKLRGSAGTDPEETPPKGSTTPTKALYLSYDLEFTGLRYEKF